MALCIVKSGNGGGVNVRSSKSTSASRLGTIPDGTYVNIVTCDATWASLVYNGSPAFVQHQYIYGAPSSFGAGLGQNERAVCNTNSVNVRKGAGTSYATNGTLSKGTAITVLEYKTVSGYVWYRFGTEKWVRGDYLAPANGTSGSSDGGKGYAPTNKYEMYGPSTEVLRNGVQGQAVFNLQITLMASGDLERDEYETQADGIFGTKTELAVIQFQSMHGLSNDGVVGENTKTKLWQTYGYQVAYRCSSVL